MADTAVAVTQLTANTPLGNIYAGANGGAVTGMVSITSGNTAVIAAKGNLRGLVVVISGDGTNDGTATIQLGNEPASESSGLAIPAGMSAAVTDGDEVVVWPLLGGQYVKSDDGAVEIAIAGTGPVYVGAFRLPLNQ